MKRITKDNKIVPIEIKLPKVVNPKIEYEFQEICLELEKTYGKLVWTLPFKKGFTEYKIRKAAEIAQKKKNTSFGYLVGIIKKLS